MKTISGSIHPEIKTKIDQMVSKGQYEGKFGHLPHAHYMVAKVHEHGVATAIEQKLGHASTLDTAPHIKLAKHYHVKVVSNTAHRILGKFV